MSEWPTVTVIVLNYDGLEHLRDCFSSLEEIDYPPESLELMLVDNASTDGSVQYVRGEYPQVRIVANGENVGFGTGNNVGAQASTSEYVVFFNNDIRATPGVVRGLVEAVHSDREVVSAAAKILDWDGSHFDFAGAAAHFAGYAYQVGMGRPFDRDQFDAAHPVLFPCGGAMIIDRQVFLDVGGFDDDYFLYYEDLDLGWRLWVLGHKVLFAPDAIVYHRHHGTVDSISDHRRRVLFKRNALCSIIKNYEEENLSKVLPAVLLASVNGVVEQAERRGQLDVDEYDVRSSEESKQDVISLDKGSVSTLVAIHDVLDSLPSVMKRRHWIQENRKRSDKDVARLFRWPFRFWPDVSAETQYKVIDAFELQPLFEEVPRRVLVVSSDILPYPGMPTVGSGLRAWGLGQGLRSRGHDVIFSMPRAALKGRLDVAPREARELAWEHNTIASVVRAAEPDVVVVCNWPVMDLLPTEQLGLPVILDQHGPHLLEREYQGFGESDDNARRKVSALRKADFFTCAGEKQLAYFQSWLKRAGWTRRERDEQSAAIPVSLSPDLPEHHFESELSAEDLTFVYGGVFLPWQDPSVGLLALLDAMERRDAGKLFLFGGKHPVYPVDTGIFEELIGQMRQSSHVVTPGMVPHDELISHYTEAHVAVDLMKRNRERELAFTTRTVEYLWCGMPVIYGDYAELSDYIQKYQAGWVVNPTDREAIDAVIHRIFEDPEEVTRRGKNAQRLVREELTWDRTIAPLDSMIRRPRMRPHDGPKRPAFGRSARYLINEARFHYRRGGLRGLWQEGWRFLRRQSRLLG